MTLALDDYFFLPKIWILKVAIRIVSFDFLPECLYFDRSYVAPTQRRGTTGSRQNVWSIRQVARGFDDILGAAE